MHSLLEIKSLILPVYIGKADEERNTAQDISFDITFAFRNPVESEVTDTLTHALCYSIVCERIKKITQNNCFSLIEKLAFEIVKMLRSYTDSSLVLIRVRVSKLHPPIEELKGGVSYTCGDFLTMEKLSSDSAH